MLRIDRIRPLVEKKLVSMGYELYKLKYIRAGSRSILRLFIDNEEGITVRDCETVSHAISVLLDVENFSQSPYTLEVSSPGIDRTLVSEKDFRRAVGKSIQVRMKEIPGKSRTVQGKLIACADSACTIETNEEATTIPLSRIISGNIVIPFT